MLAALAVLVVIFWPEPTLRVARAAVGQPFAAGGLGLLTQIIGIPALILLLLTIIFSPLSFLGLLLLLVCRCLRLGGSGVGSRTPAGACLQLGYAPCCGSRYWRVPDDTGHRRRRADPVHWMGGPFVVACIGLGAVLLTRFGSRDYQPASAVAVSETPGTAPNRPQSESGLLR